MLLLDSRTEVGSVVAYRDHLASGTYHYLPGNPTVRPGGIGLVLYRGSDGAPAGGGGLLTLDVDLAHPPDVLVAARAALVQRTGQPVDLVPVLFDEGLAQLTVLDATSHTPAQSDAAPDGVAGGAPGTGVEAQGPSGPAAVDGAGDVGRAGDASATAGAQPTQATGAGFGERILGTATPQLMGDGRAIFSVLLDPDGAIAIRAALSAGRLPAAVVYGYAFRGLRPASGFRGEVDYRMAYDYLRTRMVPNSLWLKADLDRESESLQRSGHIRIVDVDYTGSDPAVLAARRATAVDTLHELVETVFFRPATAPATLPPRAPADRVVSVPGAVATASFVLREIEQDEQQNAVYDRSEMSVSTQRIAPQGAVVLPAGADPTAIVREVELAEREGPRSFDVGVTAGADWTGVASLTVDLRSADGLRTVVLTQASPAGSVVVPGGPVTYRVVVLAEPQPGDLGATAPVIVTPFRTADGPTLVLDPASLSGRATLSVLLGAVPSDLISAVTVDVVADGARHTSVLTHERPALSVAVWGNPLLVVEATFESTAGAFRSSHPVPRGERTVALNLPRDQVSTVLVTLQDPLARLLSADVELDTGPGSARARLTLDAANPSAYWTRVRAPGDTGAYRYRVSAAHRDGTTKATDWSAAADALLIVGDRDIRLERVTVVLTGWIGVEGAMLTLTADDPAGDAPASTDVLLTDPLRADVQLAVRAGSALRYHVTGQVFFADHIVDLDLPGQSDEVLLIPPP